MFLWKISIANTPFLHTSFTVDRTSKSDHSVVSHMYKQTRKQHSEWTSDCGPTHSAENSLWNGQMAAIDSDTDTERQSLSTQPSIHHLALGHAN